MQSDHHHHHGAGHDHHGHDHGDLHEGRGHLHVPTDFGPMFAAATILNVALVAVQVFYGVVAHSVALLADAGHNFGDALGLIIAWIAHWLAKLHPTARYTYGFRSATILAALANGVILLVATGAIILEAVQRLFQPGDVAGLAVMLVAGLGIVVNGVSAGLLAAGRRGDLNIQGAFLHMVADAAVSLGVVVAGGVILLTGWNWLDPAVSIVISLVIVWGTWRLLREAVNHSLDAVPAKIDPTAVAKYLGELPGVTAIHDLHIWSMSTTEIALTCHLVIPAGHPGDEFIDAVCHHLHDTFAIVHATMQIELGDAGACRLAPDHVV
jgi:cobalt-zinc-cadmium efflux system protein